MKIQKSLFFKMLQRIMLSISGELRPLSVFVIVALFYFLLWILDPSYKLIIICFFILFALLVKKTKDWRYSILLTFIISGIVYTGKTYIFQLIPGGIYDPIFFEDGLLAYLVITPSHVLAALMALILIRDVFTKNIFIKDFGVAGLFLSLYYIWFLISDFLGSKDPNISVVFTVLSLSNLILYLYIIAYVKNIHKFVLILIGIISAFVLFESAISFQQFTSNSLTPKSLVYQAGSAYWGREADELELAFRPVGTFHHANSLGADLSIWLVILSVFYAKTRNSKILFIIFIGLITLLITQSRSSWLGFLVGILVVFYIIEKIKKVKIDFKIGKYILPFAILTIVPFYSIVLPRIQKSIYIFDKGSGSFRIEQIVGSAQLISLNPILGVGKKMVVPEGLQSIPESIFGRIPLDIHNWYLSLLAEHGIPSLIFFSMFMIISVRPWVKSIFKYSAFKNTDIKTLCTVGILTSFFIVGLFSSVSGEIYVLMFLAILNAKKISINY